MPTSRPASGRNADSPQLQKAASPKQPPARLIAPSCGNSAARPLQPPPRRAKRRRQANRTPTPHPMGAPDSSGARRRRAKRASAREPDGNDAPDESGASRSNRACRLHEGLETCLRQVGAARAPSFGRKPIPRRYRSLAPLVFTLVLHRNKYARERSRDRPLVSHPGQALTHRINAAPVLCQVPAPERRLRAHAFALPRGRRSAADSRDRV